MRPEEIKPDTQLCTILGHNAQTGYMRRYFNKIMKQNSKNATAIALNITDEHFVYTMTNVAASKVEKMMIEREFGEQATAYCDHLDGCATKNKHVDFIEIKNKEVYGYALEDDAKALFPNPTFLDEHILFVAKVMLLANRWYGTKIEVDDIPLLIGDKNG